ncbi:hypothetical protein [uncultured Bdellovibrio sp.]|uniref:hypothetical protein n=1 Tax=Bdellovibrio sp. HCB-162 TaxID=3394234 RepID=UPI0025DDAAAC|nr:hypothetical protein [uncultured Bdellovibrio sp.]
MSFLIGLLMMTGVAHAVDSAKCPDIVERRDGTQIQQIWSSSTESCFFSVTPQDAYVELNYRDHLLTTEGLFMVFNSFGPGDESQTTAAREFFMFPRVNDSFSYKWDDNARELEVTHVTGDKFVFDTKKARLKSISRANITVADYVEPGNRGGIEISNYQGLLMDGGFKVGNSPTSNANGKSTFKDSLGKSCAVRNSEVFKYFGSGDVMFKFDDKGLAAFLKNRCSQLKFP